MLRATLGSLKFYNMAGAVIILARASAMRSMHCSLTSRSWQHLVGDRLWELQLREHAGLNIMELAVHVRDRPWSSNHGRMWTLTLWSLRPLVKDQLCELQAVGASTSPNVGVSIADCRSFDRPDCQWFDCPARRRIKRKEH